MRTLPDWIYHDPQARDALALLGGIPDARARTSALLQLATILSSADQPDLGLALLDDAEREVATIGLPRSLFRGRAGRGADSSQALFASHVRLARAALLLYSGRYEDAASMLADGGGGGPAVPESLVIGSYVISAGVQTRLGRPAVAEESLRVLITRLRETEDQADLVEQWAEEARRRLAQARVRRGRPEGEADVLDDLLERAAARGNRVASWASDRMLAEIAEGRIDGLDSVAARLDAAGAADPGPRNHRIDEMWARVAVVDAVMGRDPEGPLARVTGTPRRSRHETLGECHLWVRSLVDLAERPGVERQQAANRLGGMESLLTHLGDQDARQRLVSLGERLVHELMRNEPTFPGLVGLAWRDADLGDIGTARERCHLARVLAGDDEVLRARAVHLRAVVDRTAGEPEAAYLALVGLEAVPERYVDPFAHEFAAAAGATGRVDEAVHAYGSAARKHDAHGNEQAAVDCRGNLAHLASDERVPARFEPFRSGRFDMLWG